MKLDDFDFDLPEALIATRPARPRTAARLVLAEDGKDAAKLHDYRFRQMEYTLPEEYIDEVELELHVFCTITAILIFC